MLLDGAVDTVATATGAGAAGMVDTGVAGDLILRDGRFGSTGGGSGDSDCPGVGS